MFESIAALPETLTLQADLVPMPMNWRFRVSVAGPATARRKYLLFTELHSMGIPLEGQDSVNDSGFTDLLSSLLAKMGKGAGHWGQPFEVCAVLLGGPYMNQYMARSNPLTLKAPVRPGPDFPMTQWPWNVLTNDIVPCTNLPRPTGRRLFYSRDPKLAAPPLGPPSNFYLKADGRLEDDAPNRGFDRLTFWQAVYGLAPKNVPPNITEEVFAKLLNCHPNASMPAAMPLGSFTFSGQQLMWTASRMVVVRFITSSHYVVLEYGPTGLSNVSWQQWLAGEDQNVVWNFRKMHQAPPIRWGRNSLP